MSCANDSCAMSGQQSIILVMHSSLGVATTFLSCLPAYLPSDYVMHLRQSSFILLSSLVFSLWPFAIDMCYVSCAMCHSQWAMDHVAMAMCHVICAMCYVPCGMVYVPCLTCYAPLGTVWHGSFCHVPCDMSYTKCDMLFGIASCYKIHVPCAVVG